MCKVRPFWVKTLSKEGVDDMRWQLTKRFCYLNGLNDPKREKSFQNWNYLHYETLFC
jgi:hypothetical protein